MENCRVRFAPSPTGALHIGGVRTALYNYLLAKKLGGTFILRIEDTDQTRYVPGAEDYIMEALSWLGITPDEGPGVGGDYGPYRQSERKSMYKEYALKLIENGRAYYAFDTPEELDARRQEEKEKGNHSFKYDHSVRDQMRNSLTISAEDVQKMLDEGVPYTIRLKVPTDEIVAFDDIIRSDVKFSSNELDDKVMLKADGMPTYHLANVVDDYLMKITHVIRGEEWLPSTAHHVLLYKFLGWEDAMPNFAHLPLILKPTGNGKLSKRDGAKLGIPVFPLSWESDKEEDSFKGFKDFGFLPEAVLNFLAFLGWNPGTEEEFFRLEALVEAFDLNKVSKGGARFDFDKAKWFNQQYIINSSTEDLLHAIRPIVIAKNIERSDEYLSKCIDLMKERVQFLPDFLEVGYYLFEKVRNYEEKPIRKKWKPEQKSLFEGLLNDLVELENFDAASIESTIKSFMETNGLGFGNVLPFLRIGMAGTMKGPGVFEMMELLGKEEVKDRMTAAFSAFNSIKGA
jgi:glutamyl-tRNA synthetase